VLLYEGSRLAHGQSIYLDPAHSPYWLATYPPLYQLLVALGGAHSFLWQRLVSLIAGLVSATSLALVLRRLMQPWSIAILAALLWINSLFIDTWFVFGRIDMTGRAFCSAAVACIVCIRRERLAFITALVCSVLAMLVKQNMITGGIVCAGFLWFSSRKRAMLFCGIWLGLTATAYLLLNVATHGWFWRDIFTYTSRGIDPALLWAWVSGFAAAHWPYLVAALAGSIVVMRSGKHARFLFVAVIAGLPNVLLSGNDGSDRNYFFDLIWPLCAMAALGLGGIAVDHVRKSSAVVAFLSAASILAFGVLLILSPTYYPTKAENSLAMEIIAKLRASRKPVLCELSGYAMLGGSEVEYLPYMLRKLEEDGRWNPQPIVMRLNAKQYGAILITSAAEGRFGPAVLKAMEENYEVAQTYRGPVLADGKDALMLLKPRI
jgi:hypothetical protein